MNITFSGFDMTDMVNHPSHYADGWSNGAEVIDIAENLNFNRGNAVKYIARSGKKGDELEDLRKAEFYIKREIARINSDTVDNVPRTWALLKEVPNSVKELYDREGDKLVGNGKGRWRYVLGNTVAEGFYSADSMGIYGPYTEILKCDNSSWMIT